MSDSMKSIFQHYESLDYQGAPDERTQSLEKVIQKCSFSEDEDTIAKLLKIQSIIKEHKNVFSDYCNHVDIVDGLIDILDFYCNIMFNDSTQENVIMLSNVYENAEMSREQYLLAQLFQNLYYTSGIQSLLELYRQHFKTVDYPCLDFGASGSTITFNTAFIIFADCDLNAVIDSLTVHMKQRHIKMQKIWVQDLVRENLPLFITKSYNISGFRSKQELCTEIKKVSLDSLSLWSEDIISVKNLATCIKVNLVYINGSQEMNSGIISLSRRNICGSMHNEIHKVTDSSDWSDIRYISEHQRKYKQNIYNFFYNGSWKEPIKNTYWTDEKDNLWAIATKADIDNCLKSAKTGFKKWSSLPINSRREILTALSSRLACDSEFSFKKDALWWKRLEIYYNTSFFTRNGSVEVTITREPSSVVVLTVANNSNKEMFFGELFVALSTGNSVIIMIEKGNSEFSFELLDMIGSSGFPKGVVNFIVTNKLDEPSSLTNKETLNTTVENKFFFNEQNMKFLYAKYTVPKFVFLPIN